MGISRKTEGKWTKRRLLRALPVSIAVLILAFLCLVRKGTGYTQIITVKTLYNGQVEKAYELNTPEENLADALLEVPDGQDFSSVKEIYVNGVRSELPLSAISVKEGTEYELVYGETQLSGS